MPRYRLNWITAHEYSAEFDSSNYDGDEHLFDPEDRDSFVEYIGMYKRDELLELSNDRHWVDADESGIEIVADEVVR